MLRGLQLLTIVRKLAFRYRILELRVVKTANNLPTLFVLERVESDPEYEKLQGELWAMNRYVDLGTSTFMALHSSSTASGDKFSGAKSGGGGPKK